MYQSFIFYLYMCILKSLDNLVRVILYRTFLGLIHTFKNAHDF